MATKVYKKGVNCIIDTGSGLPKIIPTAQTRFTVNGTSVQISDTFNREQGFSVVYGDLQNESGTPIGGQQACIDYLSTFVGSFSTGGTSGGTGFTLWNYTAQNYTDLTTVVAPTALDGEIAFLYNSQGTKWLPGSLGGTYWPSGFYIYNGGTAEWQIDKNLEAVAEQLHLNIQDIDDLEATRLLSVVAGRNIVIDNTDPLNPIVVNKGSNLSNRTVIQDDAVIDATLPGGPGTKQNINPAGWLISGVVQASMLRFTVVGPGNDTFGGLAAPSPAERVLVTIYNNDPTGTVTISNNNAGSLAANRFFIGGNVILGTGESLAVIYEPTLLRWIPFSKF
jgi:hypothetical protein